MIRLGNPSIRPNTWTDSDRSDHLVGNWYFVRLFGRTMIYGSDYLIANFGSNLKNIARVDLVSARVKI